jgi:DNA-binding protein YbaB
VVAVTGRGNAGTAVPPPARDAQAQVDAIVAEVQATAARVREQQRAALSVNGTARSQDGTVRAVVDATGVVTSLDLEPSVFARSTPDKLARTVVATIQAAARQARTQLDASQQSMRAPHEGVLAKAAQGAGRLGLPAVGVPEVPSTAVDPTGDTDDWQRPAETKIPDAYAGPPEDVEQVAPPTPSPAPARRPSAAPRPAAAEVEADYADEKPW